MVRYAPNSHRLRLMPDFLSMYQCLVIETPLPYTEASHPNFVRRRFWVRQFMDVFPLASMPVSVIGGVSNSEAHYPLRL
jgi:hypothetical protein